MILVIDNYDSFTYNVVQLLGDIGAEVTVARNDGITVEEIAAMAPSGIVISPGPGGPADAGISCDVIRRFGASTPVFGICLGMQAIGAVFGGRIVRARELVHGKTSAIHHDGTGLFAGVPSPFDAVRYHSLVIDTRVPVALTVTARTVDGLVMGVRHRTLPIEGVQFHPESIASEHGRALLTNFLERTRHQPTSEVA